MHSNTIFDDFRSVVRVLRGNRVDEPIKASHPHTLELATQALFDESYHQFRMLAHGDIAGSLSSDFDDMRDRIAESKRKNAFCRVIFVNVDREAVQHIQGCEVSFAKADDISRFPPFIVSDDDMVLDDKSRLWCYSPSMAQILANRFDCFWEKLSRKPL